MRMCECKNRIIRIVLVFLISLATVTLFASTSLSEDNFNYAIEEIHSYDSSLYANNINIQGFNYSPRLFANLFSALITAILGGNWNNSSMFIIQLNYVLYAIAFSYITIKMIKTYRLWVAFLVSVLGMSGALYSLAFGINGAFDVFLGTAIPLSIIAIVSVLIDEPNWKLTWVLLALAEFMHVHEGIWAGFIVAIIWLIDCFICKKIKWKNLKFSPIYIISVLLVVVPSLLNTNYVDEDLFTQIYVFIRTPHHLLVSSWGWFNIVSAGFFLLGAIFVIALECRNKKEDEFVKRIFKIEIIMIFIWGALILLEYFSTEVMSVSLIVTMYVPKALKYFTFMALIMYITIGVKKIEDKKWLQGFLLLLFTLIPYGGFAFLTPKYMVILGALILVLYAVFYQFDLDNHIFVYTADESMKYFMYLVVIGGVCCRLILLNGNSRSIVGIVKILTIVTAIVIGDFLIYQVKTRRVCLALCVGASIFAIAVSGYKTYWTIHDSKFELLTGDVYVKNAVGDSIWNLAKEFEKVTDKEEMFLADPDSYLSNGFQLVSHRSCYRLYKNTPSNKAAVITWYQDIEKARMMTSCEADELAEYLKEIDIEYVLVSSERFEVLEDSHFFENLISNNDFGVYRLRE